MKTNEKKFKRIILTLITILILSGCSMNRIVVNQMIPVLKNSADALYEETDLKIAEQALASNLKLLEGLLKSDPNNKELLLLTAEGYAGYALGFTEDEAPERAKQLYLRSRDYALRILMQDKNFVSAEKKGPEELKKLLNSYKNDKAPALFWYGFGWAGYINLSLDDPAALLKLPAVQMIMERVEQLQPDYFNGAVYLFLGSVYGMKPRIMGGDPEKARYYFQKNLDITNDRFMLSYYYLAKYYAAKILDVELFDNFLNKVTSAPVDIYPGMQLLTQIAKKKIEYLNSQRQQIF
ncbi:MAG: TRAP transporter TatT component family protein [Calditrichaceae bacterium]